MLKVKSLDRLIYLDRKEMITDRTLCKVIGVAIFVVLTALGAFVRIPLPFTPVPITAQTLFVLLAGAALGKRLGPVSQAGYVLLGAVGLPLYAGANGGFLHLVGPTGGYLIGFVAAAWVVGCLVDAIKRPSLAWIAISMLTGTAVIYLLGVAHLALMLHLDAKRAVYMGMLPFLPGDALKLAVAALIYNRFQSRFAQIFKG